MSEINTPAEIDNDTVIVDEAEQKIDADLAAIMTEHTKIDEGVVAGLFLKSIKSDLALIKAQEEASSSFRRAVKIAYHGVIVCGISPSKISKALGDMIAKDDDAVMIKSLGDNVPTSTASVTWMARVGAVINVGGDLPKSITEKMIMSWVAFIAKEKGVGIKAVDRLIKNATDSKEAADSIKNAVKVIKDGKRQEAAAAEEAKIASVVAAAAEITADDDARADAVEEILTTVADVTREMITAWSKIKSMIESGDHEIDSESISALSTIMSEIDDMITPSVLADAHKAA